jgi:MSHA biogenesis protein MshI
MVSQQSSNLATFMRFFKKNKEPDSWLSFAFVGGGLATAIVRRPAEGKPTVEAVNFYPGAGAGDGLDKIGRDLRADTHRCLAVLGTGEYQIFTVDAPNVPVDELRTAVRWRLKDMLDFPVDDATIDVLDIPPDKHAAVRPSHNLFAVAARNSVIERRQGIFSAAKIDMSVIDIPEMAQRNMSVLVEPGGRGVAMLSFSEDAGLLTVTYNGELYLSRRIDVPLAQQLVDDVQARRASFDKITLEVQRSLDNFERQFHFINLNRLVLAPSAAKGLDEYLSSQLYMSISSMDLADVLDIGAAPELADASVQQRFFVALGAGLRHEETQL